MTMVYTRTLKTKKAQRDHQHQEFYTLSTWQGQGPSYRYLKRAQRLQEQHSERHLQAMRYGMRANGAGSREFEVEPGTQNDYQSIRLICADLNCSSAAV